MPGRKSSIARSSGAQLRGYRRNTTAPRGASERKSEMEYRKIEIKQSRGPRIEFEGVLLASDTFEVRRDGTALTMEIWETRGGALVAVTRGEAIQGGEARDIIETSVVEPTRPRSDGSQGSASIDRDGATIALREGHELVGQQAMRFAVLDHFDWSDYARSMVRRQLKWSLKMRVE